MKTNPSLHFAVITGCLRITKESIFTGLNNLECISIMDKNYNGYFGFTRDEVGQLLEDYHFTSKKETLCQWYDGYSFGYADIYNPWSIINYVKELLADKDSPPRHTGPIQVLTTLSGLWLKKQMPPPVRRSKIWLPGTP